MNIAGTGLRRATALAGILTVWLAPQAHADTPALTTLDGVLAQARPATVKEEVFHMHMDEIVMQTNWGNLGPAFRTPADVALLDDPALGGSAIFLFKLRDSSGNVVGYGSEQEVHQIDDKRNTKFVWATTWTLTLPGRGTLFLEQIESGAQMLDKIKFPESGVWTGDISVQETVGPRADGRGRIVGGTGEFEGRAGSFVEINRIRKLARDMSVNPDIGVEVRLAFD